MCWCEQLTHLITALVLSLPHLKPSALRHTINQSTNQTGHWSMDTFRSSPLSPVAHPVVAPPPQVNQLEAVVTATAEQLAVVWAEVERGDFPLSRKLLNAAHDPEGDQTGLLFIHHWCVQGPAGNSDMSDLTLVVNRKVCLRWVCTHHRLHLKEALTNQRTGSNLKRCFYWMDSGWLKN